MFSKTRTNGMYSNSAARARGARVQSPKREEILRWNTYSSYAHLKKKIKGMWQTSSQIRNEIYLKNICMLWSTNRSNKVFLVPAYFRQNKSSINIHKC